jgi:uncharacterized protein YlxW (UPF0749 family)
MKPAMGDLRSQLTLAAVAFVLGILVVVQLRSQTGGSALEAVSTQNLTTLVANLNSQNDRLRTEIATLTDQLDELHADQATGATSVDQIASDLARIRAWTGLDPVSGRGVMITIGGRIEAGAVQELINELRNAGAEAIAIEDFRVVSGTTVSGEPGSLDVDGFVLGNPFRIRVIGTPETLVGSLTRAGGIVAQLAATDPSATLEVAPMDKPMLLPPSRRNLVPDHGHPRL